MSQFAKRSLASLVTKIEQLSKVGEEAVDDALKEAESAVQNQKFTFPRDSESDSLPTDFDTETLNLLNGAKPTGLVLDKKEIQESLTSTDLVVTSRSRSELTLTEEKVSSGAVEAAETTSVITAFLPLLPMEVYLVSDKVPSDIYMVDDGTVFLVTGRYAARILVPPLDVVEVESLFSEMGETFLQTQNGTLQIANGEQVLLSAAPSLAGVRLLDESAVNSAGNVEAGWSLPSEGDESQLNYTLTVDYSSGYRETWHPFVADPQFIDSINAMPDLSAVADRSTGVVNVSGMRFRPAFTVSALSAPEETYRRKLADSFGITYRLYDANADGLQDVMIYSPLGKQLLYGVKD